MDHGYKKSPFLKKIGELIKNLEDEQASWRPNFNTGLFPNFSKCREKEQITALQDLYNQAQTYNYTLEMAIEYLQSCEAKVDGLIELLTKTCSLDYAAL